MSEQATAHPDLFGLLRGELDNAAVAEAADHLQACSSCRDELAQVAVGHGLLAAASRTLSRPAPVVLPTVGSSAPRPTPPPWRRPGMLLLAAAVAVVAGIGGFVAGREDRLPGEPVEAARASAELEPVQGRGSGEVTMAVSDERVTRMTIETRDLPEPRRDEFYYAWLFDPETNKMLPLGQIGPGGRATFELPVSLLGQYSAIDISLEVDDGDPEHSVTSVLQASYDPGAVADS